MIRSQSQNQAERDLGLGGLHHASLAQSQEADLQFFDVAGGGGEEFEIAADEALALFSPRPVVHLPAQPDVLDDPEPVAEPVVEDTGYEEMDVRWYHVVSFVSVLGIVFGLSTSISVPFTLGVLGILVGALGWVLHPHVVHDEE